MSQGVPPVATAALPQKKQKRARGRPAGQVATREKILRTAINVFARYGYEGARIEKISSAAGSTDRMIYYYFGSKENLFVAVLETIYRELGDAEAALDLSGLDPQESLRAIVRFTWNHYLKHPELLTLLNNENLQQGKHVSRSRRVKDLSGPLMTILSNVLARGIKARIFRPDLDAQHTYIAICALGYFYLSNRYTLSAFLGTDLLQAKALASWLETIELAVVRFVAADPVASQHASSKVTHRAGAAATRR